MEPNANENSQNTTVKQVRLTDEQRAKLKDVFASLENEALKEALDEITGGNVAVAFKEAHASGGWKMSSAAALE
ncbi:hypothetical protein SAMN04515674_10692 [Pseudarcicella hirudinis]|uniref:Uncharacterized protein n=1 Tax=Pseudarcicella hirudinis TaxID=1079859 RepID=A0A1I5TKL4_9BACT|nr:hypothetical protein [Pseudarcicella hirudinis]SFP83590.1 hypothetical protein SAMN04515674_10692 [Pseudarcicella hirudinis]